MLREFIDSVLLKITPAIPTNVSGLGQLTDHELREIMTTSKEWYDDARLLSEFRLPQMTGGVNPGDQRAIYHLILGLRSRRVLEVGTHIGCSTIGIALAMKSLSANKGYQGKCVSVDICNVNDLETKPWLKYGASYSPREMAKKTSTSSLMDFVVSDSLSYLSRCRENFDFIFLDGSHLARRVYQEIAISLAKINNYGYILLHDYFPDLKPLWKGFGVTPGPYLAVQRLIQEGCLLKPLPLGKLEWPTKLGSSVSSLCLLTRTYS